MLSIPPLGADAVSDSGRANAFFATGNRLYHKGNYSKAVAYFHQALNYARKLNPPDHLNIAIAHNALGLAYERRGSRKQAIDHYAAALKAVSRAIRLKQQNRPEKKKRLFSFGRPKKQQPQPAAAVPIRLLMATIYNNKAIAHMNTADYGTATVLLQNAIEIKRAQLGPNHPALASSYSNLGLAYQKQHRHEQAALYHKKAVIIQLKNLNPGAPAAARQNITAEQRKKLRHRLARSYINLGTAYLHQRRYDDAIKYYRKGLPLLQQTLGDRHPETATAYSNLGVAYGHKGAREQSILFHRRALTIRLEKLRPLHPSTVLSYRYLGMAYKKKGDIRNARIQFRNGLAIATRGLGRTHRHTRFFLSQLSRRKTGAGTRRKTSRPHGRSKRQH